MISSSISRRSLVVILAIVYLLLLALPVARLAGMEVLGGLPLGMAGLLAVLVRDLPGIGRMSEISRKWLLAGALAS